MSAPVKKCEVTPLEALQRLIGAASVIDANECKDEVAYNVLQSELAVAKEVAKVLAAAPEACPDPGACDRSGCCNPGGRCEEAAPVVPVAAQPVVQAPDALLQRTDEIRQTMANPAGIGRATLIGYVECLLAHIALTNAAPSLEAQPAGEVIPADKLCALLPGPYYMDPPDGGSVTVLEQVERMAKDAARFAWLIENASSGSLGFGDWWINGDEPAEEWRAAFDAAMAQGEKA